MKKGVLPFLVLLFFGSQALSETNEIRIAKQYGINYLPFIVLEEHKLIEKYAKEAGLGDVKVLWATFGGGAATNDALLSGNIDINSNGVAPFLILWGKTKGKVKALAASDKANYILNTSNANVKSLRDFTDKDKIALPAVKVSIQALLLQIAAAQEFGIKNYNKLDHLTVTLKHPDALISILSSKSEITTHFATEPFATIELQNPNIRQVISSDEIVGKGLTTGLVSTSEKFYNENPKLVKVFLKSLNEAAEWINNNEKEAAKLYVKVTKSKESEELIYKILSERDVKFSIKPTDITLFSDFLYEIGSIKTKPTQKELFFDEISNDIYK
ncbi:MAG: ABC transporter substrate-binding protein [Campylobacteraceae bacterium]|jgi:NitT/TauT family transport system substrate-binding protein|nr:ABC transporter substrate-binding protein [Campylobacteraceae bacterium]